MTAVLVVLGIILLLPGLCTLYFVGFFAESGGVSSLLDLVKGDPIGNLILVAWGVSILLALFGIWLLRRAWRSA